MQLSPAVDRGPNKRIGSPCALPKRLRNRQAPRGPFAGERESTDGRSGVAVSPAVAWERLTARGVALVAEAHGGNAWVESEPGDEAAFHVTFAAS